jgi:hypothetical protein
MDLNFDIFFSGDIFQERKAIDIELKREMDIIFIFVLWKKYACKGVLTVLVEIYSCYPDGFHWGAENRDSNSGLTFSKPTHHYLSYAAPFAQNYSSQIQCNFLTVLILVNFSEEKKNFL